VNGSLQSIVWFPHVKHAHQAGKRYLSCTNTTTNLSLCLLLLQLHINNTSARHGMVQPLNNLPLTLSSVHIGWEMNISLSSGA